MFLSNMFWKKEKEETSRFTTVVEPATLIGHLYGWPTLCGKIAPAFRVDDDDAKILAYKEELERLEKKIELVLANLGFEYEEEKETIVEARLTKKKKK